MCCKVSLFQKPVRVTGATLSIGILLQMDYTWANAQTSAEQYGPMGRVDRRNSLRTLVGLHRCNSLGKDKSVASAKCKNRWVTCMWWDHVGGVCAGGSQKELFGLSATYTLFVKSWNFECFECCWLAIFWSFLLTLLTLVLDHANNFALAILFAFCIQWFKQILGREKLKKAGLARPVLQLRSSASDQKMVEESFPCWRNGADTVQKAERWKDSDLGKSGKNAWRVDIA